jgi:predicted ATP-binding protein involved in virulence
MFREIFFTDNQIYNKLISDPMPLVFLPFGLICDVLMKITKVTLQNFRGIGSLELDFPIDQNIIALVGINGVGKSSILDAISMLLSAIMFAKHCIDSKNDNLDEPVFISRDSDVKISEEVMSCSIILSNGDKDYEINFWRNPGGYDLISDHVISPEMPKNLLLYYPSDRKVRFIHRAGGSNLSPISKENTELHNFNDLLDWFRLAEDMENEERLEGDSNYRDRNLESVRKAVSSILGDGFGRLRIKRSINNLVINKNGINISINLLSDGEKSLIALVSDLAMKLATIYRNMEDPLAGEGIVLIDEIELHMHPTWQRMIIPRLTKTFSNCQFIVTTHSPQVLSHVQPESIYLLKKVGEDIVVTKPQYSYGRDSNRILEDLMDETERPAEIQNKLGELFSLIHQGHLSEAQQLVNQLSETIGASEPELNKAEVMIKRREIIGR